MPTPGLTRILLRGYRTIREVEFRPRRVSALVGEAGTGKSNLLEAIRSLLDPGGAPLRAGDVAREGGDRIRLEGELADGTSLVVEGPGHPASHRGTVPCPISLPASLRTSDLVVAPADPSPSARKAVETLVGAVPAESRRRDPSSGAAEAARGLVGALEACTAADLDGLVFLIEEPELFLPPQTQRYAYRLLRNLAGDGNQVLYSTHSPAFLNVARLEEIVFTERAPSQGTRLTQPEPLEAEEEFRAASEFDAARSELFLARAAILVEGLTEKLALPLVFRAMGYDPDRERISIVECGGKANVLLISRISKAVGIPFLAVHDRDAPPDAAPSSSERHLNALIADVARPEGRIELAPDFEGVSGLRGHRHKPARAWRSFAQLPRDEIPAPLARIVERAVALARR